MKALLDILPPDLRDRALLHPAFASRRADSYERLEFLGDAVLGLVVAEEIYRRFPEMGDGDMSKVRAAAVSRDACDLVAQDARLAEAMVERVAAAMPAERDRAEHLAAQRNARAALVESVIGAAFETCGYDVVAPLVRDCFEGRIEHALDNRADARSSLQEWADQSGMKVAYGSFTEEGPPHDRRFTVEARIVERGDGVTESDGQGPRATGSGRSKQEAQRQAAAVLLTQVANS